MCGILGAYWQQPPADAIERLKLGMDVLHHRGPDDQGHMAFKIPGHKNAGLHLAHVRLSILDLSSAGHQPMQSPCRRYTVVFNGEIYNYRELRNELISKGYRFNTETDTEVLISAWGEWGPACLRRFIGMFAFALHDSKKNVLTCARDAFGIKLFFYSYKPGIFTFASEIGTLLKLSDTKAAVNYQRVHDYLVYGIQDFQSETFVDGINHLLPAHVLEIDLCSGKISDPQPWWKPKICESKTLAFHDAAENLRELFLSSVRLHLRSDVPIGASLSGGIDSSAIVCGMREVEPDLTIHTLSYISEDKTISEENFVDLVNEKVGAISHKVYIEPNELMADLPDLIKTQGEPFNSTSMYAQYRIFKEARASGIPVMLEGQGADELLGGYQGYPGQRMRSMLERGCVFKVFKFARDWSKESNYQNKSPWRSMVGQLLPDSLHSFIQREQLTPGMKATLAKSKLLRHVNLSLNASQRRVEDSYGRRLKEALAHSITGHALPTLLRFGDRNAMRFSVENRVPFLTLDLADFMLGLPEKYLVTEAGETKSLFRAAMRGIVPDQILDRRDKIGFSTPMADWLAINHSIFRKKIEESRIQQLLDVECFFSEWKESPLLRSRSIDIYWRLINMAYWSYLNQKIDWA